MKTLTVGKSSRDKWDAQSGREEGGRKGKEKTREAGEEGLEGKNGGLLGRKGGGTYC